MILGVGIDMVSIPRFKAACDRYGARLYGRLFTERELQYCLGHRFPARHLAARFAAKVSLGKALGKSPGFKNVEVVRGTSGRPAFKVSGALDEFKYSLAISHNRDFSIAETVVEDLR